MILGIAQSVVYLNNWQSYLDIQFNITFYSNSDAALYF